MRKITISFLALLLLLLVGCSDSTIIISGQQQENIYTNKGILSLEGEGYHNITVNHTITISGEYFLQHATNFNGTTGFIYEHSPLLNGTPIRACGTREQSSSEKPYSNTAGCLVNLTKGDVITYGVRITTDIVSFYLNNAYLLIKKI